jgi:hypothetical protein
MRVTGFALFGSLAGAVGGLAAALLALVLWYDVLGIGQRGGDGMSGLSAALVLAPLLGLGGGVLGAIWFGRRASAGPMGPTYIVVPLILMVIGIAAMSGLLI